MVALPTINFGSNSDAPLKKRLQAWWHGHELPPVAEDDSDTPPASAVDGPPAVEFDATNPWANERLKLVQKLWGKGMLSPCGADFYVNAIKTTAPNETQSMLHLGAGLGGITREITEQFGIYVSGMEIDETLADAGMNLSHARGLESRASITAFDPETLSLPTSKYHCVLAEEIFIHVENKKRLIGEVAASMKSETNLIYADLLSGDANLVSDVLAWGSTEPGMVVPWTEDGLIDSLHEFNFDIRISQNDTEEYRTSLLTGWARAMELMESGEIPASDFNLLLYEGERWAKLIKLLDSGALTHRRVHAISEHQTNVS